MPACAGMTVFFATLFNKNLQKLITQRTNKGVMPAQAGIPFVFCDELLHSLADITRLYRRDYG